MGRWLNKTLEEARSGDAPMQIEVCPKQARRKGKIQGEIWKREAIEERKKGAHVGVWRWVCWNCAGRHEDAAAPEATRGGAAQEIRWLLGIPSRCSWW